MPGPKLLPGNWSLFWPTLLQGMGGAWPRIMVSSIQQSNMSCKEPRTYERPVINIWMRRTGPHPWEYHRREILKVFYKRRSEDKFPMSAFGKPFCTFLDVSIETLFYLLLTRTKKHLWDIRNRDRNSEKERDWEKLDRWSSPNHVKRPITPGISCPTAKKEATHEFAPQEIYYKSVLTYDLGSIRCKPFKQSHHLPNLREKFLCGS